MKIKFTQFIILLVVLWNTAGAKPKDNIDSLKNELTMLKQQLNEVKERQNYQNEQINGQTGMIDTAFDGVSAELSSSSNFIGIFGIIIAIFSVGLSIYVSRIEKNVKAMKTDSEFLLQKNIQIKLDLEALSEKMTKDTAGLYKLIRNEESNQMIDRLISVPEDIHNLFSNLASRDLEKEHFPKIKEAFLQLNDEDDGYSDYLIILFQHFSDLSFIDKDLKQKFLDSLPDNFDHSFTNDVLKSVTDFFNAIIQLSISKSITEINVYVASLCKSQFAENEKVYFTINNAINSREHKFELYDAISKAPEYSAFRKNIGKLILDYKYENQTPKEQSIIQDINNIILS